MTSGRSVQNVTCGLHERFAGLSVAAARVPEAAETHFQSALRLGEDLPHRVDLDIGRRIVVEHLDDFLEFARLLAIRGAALPEHPLDPDAIRGLYDAAVGHFERWGRLRS